MARKKKKKSALKKYFVSLFVVCLLFVVGTTVYSRISLYSKAPVLDETKDITALPPEFKNILGTTTGPNNSTDIIFKIPILLYHYVEYPDPNDKLRVALNITPYAFEQQVKTLKDAGFTFLTVTDVGRMIDGKMEVPSKGVVLTFDDGYRDFYDYAYPILKKYNARATQYVIVDFLDRPNHMFTTQVKEIAANGLIEIGSHTMDHVWLRGQDYKTVKYQVEKSKKELEEMTGKSVSAFCYPYGAFDQQAIDAIKNAGYTTATSTVLGSRVMSQNRLFLYRIRPGYYTGKNLINYITQDFSPR